MQFTPIDLSTWPRREHFHYYRNQLPCGYSVTVQLDVTPVSYTHLDVYKRQPST